VDAELRIDVVEVGANGRGRDPEPAGDLYVGQPLADQCQDFALTNGELLTPETWAFRLREAPSPCVLLELEEVREEQVDDRSIPCAEVVFAAVENEAAGYAAPNRQEELRHVLDPQRPADVCVEA